MGEDQVGSSTGPLLVLASSTWNAVQQHERTIVENWLHVGIGPGRTHSHRLERAAAHPTGRLHMVLLGGMMSGGRSVVHNYRRPKDNT